MKGESNLTVIGLTGHARSGKTTAANYIAEKLKVPAFSNSAPLADLIGHLEMDRNRSNYMAAAKAVFSVFGYGLMASHWAAEARRAGHRIIAVEGIRYSEEIEIYQKESNLVLLGIVTDDRTRYYRSQVESSNKDRGRSMDEFIRDRTSQSERNIDQIVEKSDFVIENNGSLDDLFLEIGKILRRLI